MPSNVLLAQSLLCHEDLFFPSEKWCESKRAVINCELLTYQNGPNIPCKCLCHLLAENLLRGSVATDQDSRLSWSEHMNQSAVKFAGDEEGRISGDEEEVEHLQLLL